MLRQRYLVATVLAGLISTSGAALGTPAWIAGLHPDHRPEKAPVITTVKKDGAWYQHALTGVIPPYPASLHFLESQGNWYTPFNHPGMTGRYDIRGWHRR